METKTPLQARLASLRAGVQSRQADRQKAQQACAKRIADRLDRHAADRADHALRVIRHGDFSTNGCLVQAGHLAE